MSYFIITGTEDGIQITQLDSRSSCTEYLNNFYAGSSVVYLSNVPKDMYDFHDLDIEKVLVIEGNVVLPTPVTIAKEYRLD